MRIHRIAGQVAGGVLLGGALAGFAAAPASAAEPFPNNKPITIVIPFAPGGGTDTMGRFLANQLAAVLETSVVVDNRTGAAGRIGADSVAKSKPDGYRLMFAGPTVTVFLPILEPASMPFDARTALTTVAYFYKYDLVLSTSPQSRIASLKQLADFMRTTKDQISAGTGGVGTSPHLAAVVLANVVGVPVTPVHYRGSSLATMDTIANRLLFNFESVVATEPHIKAGKLVGLAITGSSRSPALPDIPTMAEGGLPEFAKVDWAQWSALFAPASVPRDVLVKLHGAVTTIMKDPKTAASFAKLNAELMPVMGLEETQSYATQQYDKWEKMLVPLRGSLKE